MSRLQIKPCDGFWWTLVDERLSLWVLIGELPLVKLKDLASIASLAKIYYEGGIIGKVCTAGFIGDFSNKESSAFVDLRTGEVREAATLAV